MNDFEMTKLCAEVLRGDDKSITIIISDGHVWNQWDDGSWAQNPQKFDPLHDDAQAMALVKKLRLNIFPPMAMMKWQVWIDGKVEECTDEDLNRAIVECVAKMASHD